MKLGRVDYGLSVVVQWSTGIFIHVSFVVRFVQLLDHRRCQICHSDRVEPSPPFTFLRGRLLRAICYEGKP